MASVVAGVYAGVLLYPTLWGFYTAVVEVDRDLCV